MGFFDFNKKQQPITPEKPTLATFSAFDMNCDYTSSFETPYNSGLNGYLYGPNGLFPQELNKLYNSSALHQAIINFKKWLTVGNGYEIDRNFLTPDQKTASFQLTNFFDKMLEGLALDLYLHNRLAIEVTWNKDNTKILKLKRIPVDKVRIKDVDHCQEPTRFVYNYDWVFATKYPKIEYPVFDQLNKNDKVQLYYFQYESPGMLYYAKPSYVSAINWIYLDAEMAEYHKANINNSLNPSLWVQYFQDATPEEKESVKNQWNQTFKGARKTGKVVVTFGKNKDVAPILTQMDPTKLDKTFLQLTDTIIRQICYAHETDPMLRGLKTPGSLGNSADLPYVYKIFNESVIKPTQRKLEMILDEFLIINGVPSQITLNNNTDLIV